MAIEEKPSMKKFGLERAINLTASIIAIAQAIFFAPMLFRNPESYTFYNSVRQLSLSLRIAFFVTLLTAVYYIFAVLFRKAASIESNVKFVLFIALSFISALVSLGYLQSFFLGHPTTLTDKARLFDYLFGLCFMEWFFIWLEFYDHQEKRYASGISLLLLCVYLLNFILVLV